MSTYKVDALRLTKRSREETYLLCRIEEQDGIGRPIEVMRCIPRNEAEFLQFAQWLQDQVGISNGEKKKRKKKR